MRSWGVYTFDPGRISVIGGAERELLPTAFTGCSTSPGLDAFASSSACRPDLNQWQVAGVGRQMPVGPAASCTSSIDPGIVAEASLKFDHLEARWGLATAISGAREWAPAGGTLTEQVESPGGRPLRAARRLRAATL